MILKVSDPNFMGKMYVAKKDIAAISITESQDVYIFIKGVTGKVKISSDHLKENDPLYDVIVSLRFN